MEFTKETFASNLRRLMDEKGLRQTALTKIVFGGSTRQGQFSKYLSGEVAPQIETVVRIAQALDVSIDELCGYEKPKLTPMEWLCYLEELLNNPPIDFDNTNRAMFKAIRLELNTHQYGSFFSIDFLGGRFTDFFNSYIALRGTKNNLDPEIYQGAIKNLFGKFCDEFTPGYSPYALLEDSINDEPEDESPQEIDG